MKYAILFTILIHSKAFSEKICDSFYIKNPAIEFSDNEKIFICGSKSAGWKKIPLNQAKVSIKNFLTARGYFRPKFENRNNKIYVYPKEISKIRSVTFLSAPKNFYRLKYNDKIGDILNESNLNEIKSWTQNHLDSIGFPCSEIKVAASYITGEVKVKIQAEDRIKIEKIFRENTNELYQNAYKRHDAIDIGDYYNKDYLVLTSRRMMTSGLSSYSYFSHSCKNKGFINQKIILNDPNLLIFGIGASTEEFPILKASYRNTRLDKKGSSFESSLYLSSRERSLNIESQHYFFKSMPRLYFSPEAEYEEIFEDIFSTKTKIYKASLGRSFDIENYSLETLLSLSQTEELQDDGKAPNQTDFYSITGEIDLMSHYYEYFLNSPRRGSFYSLKTSVFDGDDNLKGHTFSFKYKSLFNIRAFDPPNYILALRFYYDALGTNSLDSTPQRLRLYLGGERDIRGFSRKSINNDELGFKTAAHLGIESRFNRILPFQLQPLLFLDFAKVGIKTHQFLSTLLYSPGVGLRWASPFGTFRGTIARGMMTNNLLKLKEQTNMILTYGREF